MTKLAMYFLSAVFQCEVHMYVDSNCIILQVFFHERVATEDYIATHACAHNAGNFIVLQLRSYMIVHIMYMQVAYVINCKFIDFV